MTQGVYSEAEQLEGNGISFLYQQKLHESSKRGFRGQGSRRNFRKLRLNQWKSRRTPFGSKVGQRSGPSGSTTSIATSTKYGPMDAQFKELCEKWNNVSTPKRGDATPIVRSRASTTRQYRRY